MLHAATTSLAGDDSAVTAITQREGWIATLKMGKSPFDKQLLDSLLAEGRPTNRPQPVRA